MAKVYMGDRIEAALKKVGITEERVSVVTWIWGCGCKERKEKFNRLHQWAEEVMGEVYEGILSAKEALGSLIRPGEAKTDDPTV